MKGPFSSPAGRTAATKARLDTLCPESPLQLASPPGTPLILTSLSFPLMPGSHQGPGTAVGKDSLSQQPEGSNRSAEGQRQPLPPVQELPTSFKTRGAVGGIVGQRGAYPPPPSGGVDKGRGTRGHRNAGQIAHPGGPEYALHSADGAQPGGNDPHPYPQCISLASIPAPVSALPIAPRAKGGGWACSKWGEGQVILYPLHWVLCGSGFFLPIRVLY